MMMRIMILIEHLIYTRLSCESFTCIILFNLHKTYNIIIIILVFEGEEMGHRERERLTQGHASRIDLDRGYPLIEVFLEFKGRTESYKIKTVSH